MTSEETRKAAERLVKASKCTTLESLHELYGHHPLAFDSIEKTRDAIDRDKEITSGAYLDRLADDEHREFERTRLLSLLREVSLCSVSYETAHYLELQVHRTFLADILTALQDAEKGRT